MWIGSELYPEKEIRTKEKYHILFISKQFV